MATTEEKNKYLCPKAPKPKITAIPKKISYINLIEADDDSDSCQNEREVERISYTKGKFKNDGYLSDDRYEDSFDEEFGDGCETNPDSGKTKIISED